jgi:Uma2 family endonuclease
MMRTSARRMEDLPHYTYEDYVQWEGHWELIGGIPYAMAPTPVKKHQWVSSKIIVQLGELLKDCGQCEVLLPVDWPITEDTVVQPDVLVVCGEEMEGPRIESPPVLIFEVLSPSTSHKDRVIKYRLYQEAGVKYYCIVDPDANSATVFVLKKDQYSQAGDFKEGRLPFDLGPCQILFDFAKIFG